MSKFKNMYKEFFGLKEQSDSKIPNPKDIEASTKAIGDLS